MQIYVYFAVLFLYVLLFFLAFRKKGRSGAGIRAFGLSAAAWLYDLYLSARCGKMPEILQEGRVRRDLDALYPGRRPEEGEVSCQIRWIRRSLLVVLAGDLLAIAAFAAGGMTMHLQEDGSLLREEQGGEDLTISLTAKDREEGGEETLSMTLHAVRLSREETDRLEQKLAKELPGMILGENGNLQTVSRPLLLPSRVEGFPFVLSWESSSYALIDSDGTVCCEGLAEGGSAEVFLTAVITYDDGTPAGLRYEETIPVTVVQPPRSGEEAVRTAMAQALTQAEQQDLSAREVILPREIGGIGMTYTERQQDRSGEVFVFFMAAGVLAGAASVSRLHTRALERDREIEADYPQLVSKLVLYLGAGISMRGCFIRLGESYRAGREAGGGKRFLEEEILLVCRELESGVPEAEAYGRFGKRCRSGRYAKLCSLLVQNLQKGSRSLLAALQEEAEAAVENRRSRAREIGEEAETKLLLPMGMMLVITTVMIIVPAYYAFSM